MGPSKNHRVEHQQWDGLALPKDDPFWNTHFPPNGWGCRCYARFISQASYDQYQSKGIKNPPNLEGDSDVTKLITHRPVIRYTTFSNKRTGNIERVPDGIDPGFAWNAGLVGREMPLFTEFLKKTRDKFPLQFDDVAKSVMYNSVKAEQFANFVDRAWDGKMRGDYLTAVGFVDGGVVQWLKNYVNLDLKEGTVITLEARLINATKAPRHQMTQDALTKEQWRRLLKGLVSAQVYYEKETENLIYLMLSNGGQRVKVVVDPIRSLERSGTTIVNPLIVSASQIGKDEYSRISAQQRIR